jgi:hypothetical protein
MNPWPKSWSIFIALIIALIPIVVALVYHPPQLTGLFYDDAYYYFKTADNFVTGHKISFDGVNSTNGFHPLWFLISVLFYGIGHLIGVGHIIMLRVMAITVGIISGLSVLIFYDFFCKKLSHFYAIIFLGVFCLFPGFMRNIYSGLEIALELLIFSFVIKQLFDYLHNIEVSRSRPQDDLLLGIAFGLLVLSRLDTALVVVGCSLMIFLIRLPALRSRKDIGAIILSLFRIWLPITLLLVPYLFYNYIEFKHIIPISGAVKSTFPTPHFSAGVSFAKPNIRYFVIAPFIILTSFLGIVARAKMKNMGTNFLIINKIVEILGLGVIIDLIYKLLFIRWSLMSWYFSLYVPIFAISMLLVVKYTIEISRRLFRDDIYQKFLTAATKTMSSIILIGLLLYTYKTYASLSGAGNYTIPSMAAIEWMDQNLPEDAIIGMSDSGVYGYMSNRRIINLDGLINNWEYQDYLRSNRFERYLDDQGIDYLLQLYPVAFIPDTGNYSMVFQVYSPYQTARTTVSSSDEVFRHVSKHRWMVAIWARKGNSRNIAANQWSR